MGIITVDKADHLYWLGRYTERVHTTLKLFFVDFDRMIDRSENAYQEMCKALNIPDVYGSKQTFITHYPYDTKDPNSILSNLMRSYDNALVMRDEIGTLTLSYIQLAIYDMEKAKTSDAPMIALQDVIDHILAFWGCVDDAIDDEKTRSLIKAGKRIERLDLLLCLNSDIHLIQRECRKLERRLPRIGLAYNEEALERFKQQLFQEDFNRFSALHDLETILVL